jgi:hypothetical protein
MERWTIENRGFQQVLTHSCDKFRPMDTSEVLHLDIAGYVRCQRCGEEYVPSAAPGEGNILLRLQFDTDTFLDPTHAF